MRCKKHPSDPSSGPGVCASCLRERLLALIAAQSQLHHHHHHHPNLAQLVGLHSRAAADDCLNSHPHNPPPLVFPRSVSPYVSRRKSEDTPSWSDHQLRFYTTPQVGPTYNTSSSAANTTTTTTTSSRRKQRGRFSLFSNLFRPRPEKLSPDPSSPDASSNSSPSWLSIFSTRRIRQSKQFSAENTGTATRKPRRCTDRGMSPVRRADPDEHYDCDHSPSGSGYSSESSPGWKRTPVAQTRRGKAAHQKNMPGLVFCLSPLVRASPNRHRNQRGRLPPDMGYSSDVRVQAKPHLSTGKLLCANRSRKLVDFGRVAHNR